MDQCVEIIRITLQHGLADTQRHCGIAAGDRGVGDVQGIWPWRSNRLVWAWLRTGSQTRDEKGYQQSMICHFFHFI